MADIDITCQSCGTVVTVSEFADPSLLKCPKCGVKLEKKAGPSSSIPKPRPTVALRPTLAAAPSGAAGEEPPKEWRFHAHMRQKQAREKTGPGLHVHVVLSWLLFLILGGALGYCRYGRILPPDYLAAMKLYAPAVIGIAYVFIVLSSFKYSIYQGILSVLIPLYPFFYLFTVADTFYFRAFVGALLVGFGYDAGLFVNKWAGIIYYEISQWIQRGGV